MKISKDAACKSCLAGVARISLNRGAKHVAAFIRLFKDAGSIPATSTIKMQKSKVKTQKHNLKVKSFKFLLVVLPFYFLLLTFSGCATVSIKENLPTYNLNGVTYYALVPLCEAKGISWQYDAFTRVINLNKGVHKISLRSGDDLVLVDQRAVLLNHPVDIYEGAIIVPSGFKEQIIDTLFKEARPTPGRKTGFSISNSIKKVVIDPGHGGNDPGAIGRTGLREKDVNLDIAKRLAVLLKSESVEVVMTRNSDIFIPLDRRVEITNRSKADLFISIHSNASRVKSLNGFEVYYVATSVSDAKRALLAAKNANLDLASACFASRSFDLKAMLWDMIYTYDRAESIQLARNICRTAGSGLDVRIIGVKDARYEVLRGARIPAVLVETGFVSNYNEERMLRNGFYREKVAESILEGLRDYARDLAQMEVAGR